MNIEIVDGHSPECDAYVDTRPDGRICHLTAWSDMVSTLFGHRPMYLVAREDDSICGVLPTTQVRSRLFGNRIISQAFSDYGGVLCDHDEARDALYGGAVELAVQRGCETIEFRNFDLLPYDLHRRTDKVTMLIPLDGGAEQVWTNVRPEIRKQTRKAKKLGLVSDSGGDELLKDYYRIYSARMHELGTPAYPRKLMSGLLNAFPGQVRLFVTRADNGDTVAAGLATCYNGMAEVRFSATLTRFNRMYPNRLLYWTMVEYYCEHGARVFDFGRSTVGGGNYEFKRRWRAQEVPLHYQYWASEGARWTPVVPTDPKYQRKVEMWKRMPLWLARLIGPRISRSLA